MSRTDVSSGTEEEQKGHMPSDDVTLDKCPSGVFTQSFHTSWG